MSNATILYTSNATNTISGNLTNATIILNSSSTGTSDGNFFYTLTQWSIVEPLFNNLWAVFLVIVGFYFAHNWIQGYKGGEGGEGGVDEQKKDENP